MSDSIPIERPMDILLHLVQDGCTPFSRILGHAKSLEKAIELDREEHLKSFKNKLTGIVNKFFIEHPIIYDEYGAGARLKNSGGLLIADFEDHIDAETFMELINEIRNWSIDLRGEETKESQNKEVEKVEQDLYLFGE